MSNVNNPTAPAPVNPTTQTDVTSTRAIDGTVYHNNGRTPIFVSITVTLASLNSISFYTDATATPTLAVSNLYVAAGAGETATVTFIVLAGSYYKAVVLNGSPVLVYWIEWN